MMKFIIIISVSPVPVKENGPEGPFFAYPIRRSGEASYP
jgi:hypothetical protein